MTDNVHLDKINVPITTDPRTENNTGLNPTGTGTGVPRGGRNEVEGGGQAPQEVQPRGPVKYQGIVVDNDTKLQALIGQFGTSPNTLRLHSDDDGHQELHLHHEGKIDNVFTRGGKREGAREFIKDMVAREFGEDRAEELLALAGIGETKIRGTDLGNLKSVLTTERKEAPTRENKAKYDEWMSNGGDRVTVLGWQRAREGSEDRLIKTDRQGELREFNDGRLHLDTDSEVKISSGGAGGVLLVGGEPGVVLKVEAKELLQDAKFVSDVHGYVDSHSDAPLPFDLPKHELIELPSKSEELAPGLKLYRNRDEHNVEDRKTLKSTLDGLSEGQERSNKVKEYQKSFEENGGLVSKYEWLHGKQLDTMPFNDKVALMRSGYLGHDLGSSIVILPALGLRDHVKLGGLGGNTNLNNFMWGEDGRLKVFDFSTLPNYDVNGQLVREGDDERLVDAYKGLIDLLKRATEAENPEQFLSDELDKAIDNPNQHPFGPLLDGLLSPGTVHDGSFFKTKTEGLLVEQLIEREDRLSLLANAITGAIEGLDFIGRNWQHFVGAHEQDGVKEIDRILEPGIFEGIGKEIVEAEPQRMLLEFKDRYWEHLQPRISRE
jgi:hypothetical protein